MALQIVEESFKENMGAPDKKTERYLEAILEAGMIKPGELAKKFGVAGSSISGWAYKRIQDGVLVWCDDAGSEFSDDKVLKTAKHRGMAYLKTSENYARGNITGLPTPFELTGDPRWDEGGDLLKLYDLELEKRTAVRSVLGCSGVFNTVPNTPEKKESIENIEESEFEDDRVRVLGQKTEGKGNMFEEEEYGRGNGKEPVSSPDPNELGDEYEFKDLSPEPKPQKRKSIFDQLGISEPETRELTEEEQRKLKELADEFKECMEIKKSEDIWKGFGSENAI